MDILIVIALSIIIAPGLLAAMIAVILVQNSHEDTREKEYRVYYETHPNAWDPHCSHERGSKLVIARDEDHARWWVEDENTTVISVEFVRYAG